MKAQTAILFASVAALTFSVPAIAEMTVTKETTTTHSSSVAAPVSSTTVQTTTTTGVAPVIVPPVGATSTVVTETTTSEKAMPVTDTRIINFMAYDTNKDSILSTNEIGEMLFKLYDTDGNEVIDNNEFERKAVLTTTPVEKTTVTKYDFNNDGIADEASYTYETFMKDSQLARFDAHKDGLSPHEFTGKYFISVDSNKDKAIEMKEWQGTYIASIAKKNAEENRTNK